MEWYTWAFSGIGVYVVGLIVKWLLHRTNHKIHSEKPSAKVKGNDNISIQNSSNSNITINK